MLQFGASFWAEEQVLEGKEQFRCGIFEVEYFVLVGSHVSVENGLYYSTLCIGVAAEELFPFQIISRQFYHSNLHLLCLSFDEVLLAIPPSSQHCNYPLSQALKHPVHASRGRLLVDVLFVEGEEGEGLDVFGKCAVGVEGEFGLQVFKNFLEESMLLDLLGRLKQLV